MPKQKTPTIVRGLFFEQKNRRHQATTRLSERAGEPKERM